MRQRAMRLLTVVLMGVGVLAVMPLTQASAAAHCSKAVTFHGQRVPASSDGSVTCDMGEGSVSSAVTVLQDALRFCFSRTISIDGDFGPQTKSVLESVQRQIGVSADGVYGPITRSHMRFVSAGDVFPGCQPVG